MNSSRVEVVVLAAGQGTRMKSDLPKVLHPLAGRPLLAHVLDAARALNPMRVHVVYGHGGELVPRTLNAPDVVWVEQRERLGTGHAVSQAMPGVDEASVVIVLYGDVPLVTPASLVPVLDAARQGALGILTVDINDSTGYGRIIRDSSGSVARIVEEKDASGAEREIREVNTGILAAPASKLGRWLEELDNRNAQGEFYLTDVVGKAVQEGIRVDACKASNMLDVLGVNDRIQLSMLERELQGRRAKTLMVNGATLADPARVDIRGEVTVGKDVFIDVNVLFEGRVTLGNGVRIGANCVLKSVVVGEQVQIKPMSLIEEAVIGAGSIIGPFARVRPGTVLADEVHVGNFVEIKNSDIGRGSKVNHLSYIGDTTMGSSVNIGAGTITCNYDGANKFRTTIGDNVFVGSDTQLVAPVEVGAGATIGAGSTITRDAPANQLTLTRAPQKSIAEWRRPTKKPIGEV